MELSQFDFELPPGRIAQQPTSERDASRLMRLNRPSGRISHHSFRDLPDLLRPGDLLVANRSRVRPARLLGRGAGGGPVEILLLCANADGSWDALVRPGRRLPPGSTVTIANGFSVGIETPALGADGRRRVRPLCAADRFPGLLERHGHAPLPPYIQRPDRAQDRERYQTVYACEPGSAAAPTAGLHFTPALLARLARRAIGWAEIVLHVGPGTFRPMTTAYVEEHRVEPEPFLVPEPAATAVARARKRGGRVVAVGTTVVRTLETAADARGTIRAGAGRTDLVVFPGYRFSVVDALITNFHLPRSSLLMLVSAFAGLEQTRNCYREAIASGYRFYSYGDAMLVE